MEKNSFWGGVILGISIGLGIIIAGLSISYSFYKTRGTERYVTVRGLAERNVYADFAIWPLSFNETGNNLAELYKIVNIKRQTIKKFLIDSGFEDSEISFSTTSIRDTQADPMYRMQQARSENRYIAQQTVSLRTDKVSLVKQTMEKSSELIGKGIVLVAESYRTEFEFLFTGLNKIKPEMISEATQNARKSAEQFAKDSGSKVGKIRNASQGLFTINVMERNSPEYKVVRVVTTTEYYIEN